MLEFYLVKNNSITSELISQLDEALKDEKTIKSETSKSNITGEKDKNNDTEKTKQVSELFSQEKPLEEDSLNIDVVKDIFDDAPFSSYLTALPGDIGVDEKNIYSLKKLY